MSDLDLNAAITYLRAIAESVTVGHYGDALGRVLDAAGAVAATEARLAEAEEDVDGEAAAHNDTISAWREAEDKLREAEATIDAVEALLDTPTDERGITWWEWIEDDLGGTLYSDLRRILTRHQDKREEGSRDA